MKYVLVIPDGCSDEAQPKLDGKTPLQAALTPAMDEVAKRGIVGSANHVPDAFSPGSAVANMSLMGFDPCRFFTGRAPIEAVAQGIELSGHDWAIRCNLVTVESGKMKSFTAGHIPSGEAQLLLDDLQKSADLEFSNTGFRFEFTPGVSYRNLVICRSQDGSPGPFAADTAAHPPHDLTDHPIHPGLPSGRGSEILIRLMSLSRELFADHAVNRKRRQEGRLPATEVWLWGLGQRPALPNFQETFGKIGAMITAVDLLRGLARLLGWSVIDVPGATGYLDTDYRAKGEAAIEALATHDLVCVHIEATDEASHEGNQFEKIRALENIDRWIVGPLLESLSKVDRWRILISPDHPTFLRTKTHSRGEVPFAACGTGIQADRNSEYNEGLAFRSRIQFSRGFELMPNWLDTGYSF